MGRVWKLHQNVNTDEIIPGVTTSPRIGRNWLGTACARCGRISRRTCSLETWLSPQPTSAAAHRANMPR